MSGLDDILRRADHQARVLGNLVRGLQLVGEGWEAARSDPELRLHLRRLARWVGARLQPYHEPDGLAERLGLPPELVPGPAGATAERTEGIDALLLDSDASGEAFVARLLLAGPELVPLSFGASFDAALDRARRVVFRLLTRSGGGLRLDAGRLSADRFRLEGPQAAQLYRLDGGSVAAAAALMLFARWTGRGLPAGLVVTGGLGEDGAVLPVDGVEAKVEAALRERPGLSRLVLPRDQRPSGPDQRVLGVGTLEELLEAALGPLPRTGAAGPVDVEGTVRLGLELYEKQGSFALAHEVLGQALAAIDEVRGARGDARLHRVERLLALWRAGSSLVHLGDVDGAERLFAEARPLAERLWHDGEIDPRVYLGFRGNLAVLLRDRFAYNEAEAVLLQTLEQQRGLRQDRREVAKTLGNLGELYTFMGRFEEAEAALGEALEALRAVYPDEVPRELCYLGNLHLRRGDPALALACYEEGLRLNRQVTYGRLRNEAFLRYGTVRALRRLGRAELSESHADRALALLPPSELYPRQPILRERGLARLDLGRWEAGEQDLRRAADLTFARGALAALAAGTALGALALAELERGRLEQATALARRFRAAGAELWPRLCPEAAELEQALDGSDGVRLASLLQRTLEAFPY